MFGKKLKNFFFTPTGGASRTKRDSGAYTLELMPYNRNPIWGTGAQAYSFEYFQTLPILEMVHGNGIVPGGEFSRFQGRPPGAGYWKALGQNNLVALRPAGPKQDVVGIPTGVTELFPEPVRVEDIEPAGA
jgi:hypothetical protein